MGARLSAAGSATRGARVGPALSAPPPYPPLSFVLPCSRGSSRSAFRPDRENFACLLGFRDLMHSGSRSRALALVVVVAFLVSGVQPVWGADPERERLDQTEGEEEQKKAGLEG